jgi:hypothetical protein
MTEYPVVAREIGGKMRLGVEDDDELEANVRDVVAQGYQRVDVETAEDGEQVGTVVASEDGAEVESVRWVQE